LKNFGSARFFINCPNDTLGARGFSTLAKSQRKKYSDGRASGKNLWNQARYLTVLFDLPLTNQNV
jgi:hypothetical protein